MIVEVGIGEEKPRRYQVFREGDRVVVRHLEDIADGGSATDTSIDWRRPQPGIYSLLMNDTSHEVFIEEEAGHLAVHLSNQTFKVRAADVRRHRTTSDATAANDGLVRITVPIPGRVSRVLVAPGDRIARGDGMVVVEAMKMENELRAPRDGVVCTVDVEEGQGVEGGALLATLE